MSPRSDRSLSRRVRAVALIAAIGALAPASAGAQSTQAREREVIAVINRMFDALRAGDSAGVRAVFDPDVKFTSVSMRPDSTIIETEPLDDFIRAVGTPRTEKLDERLRSPVVHVDGDLASVWTEYDFYVGTRFSHCGVDAFQLVRRPQGWRVVALADTRRRTGCAAASQ